MICIKNYTILIFFLILSLSNIALGNGEKKISVGVVEFEGNSAFTDGRLRGLMLTRPARFLAPSKYHPEIFEDDLINIIAFYRQNGYLEAALVDTSVTLIFGGQIQGGPPALYLVYSAGNFISDSDETPYLQIGESKYGKPILDRIITRDTSLEDAARCAIVSMDSTIKSNATVGPPIEVLVYEKDSFETNHYIKMEEDDEYLREIKQAWNEALNTAFSKLPLFHWEKRTKVNLHAVQENYPD